ncbi:MAG: hypothetical protein KDB14_24010 [Planctomycetales bacterium]|nr:hypothetical protein [Planctomycetales bacterium]
MAEAKNPTPRAQQAMGNPPHAGEDAHATNYRSGNSKNIPNASYLTTPHCLCAKSLRDLRDLRGSQLIRFVVFTHQIDAS